MRASFKLRAALVLGLVTTFAAGCRDDAPSADGESPTSGRAAQTNITGAPVDSGPAGASAAGKSLGDPAGTGAAP